MKLSIILPVYNVEKYIDRCLESIYSQGFSTNEFEVIVVDDCSPDKSLSIVKNWQERVPNIVVVNHTRNLGLGAARNTGLKNATGKYIWYIDTDDKIEEGSILLAIENLCKNELDVLVFNFYKEDVYGNFMEDNLNQKNELPVMSGSEYLKDNYHPSAFSSCSKIYKRELLLNNSFFFAEGVYWEDADLVVRILYNANRLKYIPDHLYYYCNNAQSISRSISGKKLADMVKMGERKLLFANSIENENPKLASMVKIDALWNTRAVKNIVKLGKKDIDIFYDELRGCSVIKSVVKNPYHRFLFTNEPYVKMFVWLICLFRK